LIISYFISEFSCKMVGKFKSLFREKKWKHFLCKGSPDIKYEIKRAKASGNALYWDFLRQVFYDDREVYHLNIKLKEKDKAGMAVKVLFFFITGIYPLILFELDMGSFHIQSFLLFISVMGALLFCALFIKNGQWKLWVPRSRLEIGILILAVYALFRIIAKMITATEARTVCFDFEIVVLAFAAVYLLFAAMLAFEEKYFDIVIFSGLIVFMLLLVRYICGEGMEKALAVLQRSKADVASLCMLVCMAGLWQYIRCRDKLRSAFYIGALTVGFLVLIINQNRVSLYLMSMVFLAIPVVERPTAELVKRDMQMFFLYLFLLCNISLLADYTSLLQVEVDYPLKQSVYLELLAAVGSIFFFRLWDRVPEGMDLNRLIMRKMRRDCQFLLNAMGIILAGVLIGGEHWKDLSDHRGLGVLKGFAVPLAEETGQAKSAFYQIYEELGLPGGTLILIICILGIGRLKKNYGFDKPVTGMLILISCVFLIQLLFWKLGVTVWVLYWGFAVMAMNSKEKRVKVTSSKIKFD